MWIPFLSSRSQSRPQQPSARRKPASTRLTVEALEDRTVPALFNPTNVSELMAAINSANQNGETDTITLDAGQTYKLTSALPALTAAENLTILGNSATIQRSTGNNTPAFRLITVAAAGSASLQDLTLRGGLVIDYDAAGGGIYNAGNLTLTSVTIRDCTALGYDGWDGSPDGFLGAFGSPGGDAKGGGVYSSGTLQMDYCTITNCAAIGGKGGDGAKTVYGLAPGGSGGNAYGAGVYIAGGTATIRHSTITSNTAKGGAAGKGGNSYYDMYWDAQPGQSYGGGIYGYGDVGLDAFTITECKQNKASTSGNNLAGHYHEIV